MTTSTTQNVGQVPQAECTKCSSAVPADSQFCPSCGNRIESTSCPKCKQSNALSATYCRHCGVDMDAYACSLEELNRVRSLCEANDAQELDRYVQTIDPDSVLYSESIRLRLDWYINAATTASQSCDIPALEELLASTTDETLRAELTSRLEAEQEDASVFATGVDALVEVQGAIANASSASEASSKMPSFMSDLALLRRLSRGLPTRVKTLEQFKETERYVVNSRLTPAWYVGLAVLALIPWPIGIVLVAIVSSSKYYSWKRKYPQKAKAILMYSYLVAGISLLIYLFTSAILFLSFLTGL